VSSRITDAEMAQRVEEHVLRRIDADDLILPVLPTVVTRCLEALDPPDFSVNDVARLIESDPLIAAGVVRLANSAARASLEPSRSVLQSVMRLGGDELRAFLFEVAVRPIFDSHDPGISELGRSLWAHSVAVGLLARAIVRRVGGPQPEAAYLAGLLHDVGKPVLAAMLLDSERRLFGVRTRTWLGPGAWMALIRASHRRVGVALANAWRLLELVRRSIAHADHYDAGARDNPANAVCLANALAKLAGVAAGDVDPAELQSLLSAGRSLFVLSEHDVQALTDGLRARVDQRLA